MEKQVLSIEQMRELIDMGIDISKASCTWCKVRAITSDRKGYSWMVLPETLNKFDEDHVPTFTLQDILEMLPYELPSNSTDFISYSLKMIKWDDGYMLEYQEQYYDEDYTLMSFMENTPLQAAFNMLKWCKENNYI